MRGLLFILFFIFSTMLTGQIIITESTFTYENNFTGFNGSTDPDGWVTLDVASTSTWLGTNSGSSITGGKYSYGQSNDGSLGFLPSSTRAINAKILFVNNSGETITNITVKYVAEHWRSALDERNNGWAVSYAINGGTPIDLSSLTYIAPNNIATGEGPHGSEALEETFDITLIDGEEIEFTFFGDNGTGMGARQGVAIDDFEFIVNETLPVKFSKFSAEVKGKTSVLNFSTASEVNNDYFTIERSSDGRTYDAIGALKGAGNSSEELYYSYIDEAPLKGVGYYRIKQTDFDGAFDYSEVRSVRHLGHNNIVISPRTTEGRMSITTDMESYSVSIISSSGQEVKRFTQLSQNQDISIDELVNGVYFVHIGHAQHSETIRVVKL